MKLKGSDFVEIYVNWLKSNIKFDEIGEYTEISTPFFDRHNDHMQIYVKQIEGKLVLSDDGYIISDLLLSGCDINSVRRRSVLESIINGVGVKLGKNDELYIEATIDNFPQKKHMLIQAMMSVNDMFMLSQHRVASIFLEDVESFLLQNDVRFIPNVQFTGKSGFSHAFDFVIPSSRVKPERILKVMNSPTKEKAKATLFSWTDIREVRKNEPKLFIFLNDIDHDIKTDVLNAFGEYSINPILWSKRDNSLSELVS